MRKKRLHSLTNAVYRAPQSDDLVQRHFTAPVARSEVYHDMTESKCADGKLYLAAVPDCFDGAAVGYTMHTHMRAGLCCDAMRNTVWNTVRCSRNTDAFGSAWGERISALRTRGWRVLFATLKKDLIYRLYCISMPCEQVRQIVFRWIETYYNPLQRNTANEEHLPPPVKRTCWLVTHT